MYHKKVLLTSFYLSGHTCTGVSSTGSKGSTTLHSKQYHKKVMFSSFHLNSHNLTEKQLPCVWKVAYLASPSFLFFWLEIGHKGIGATQVSSSEWENPASSSHSGRRITMNTNAIIFFSIVGWLSQCWAQDGFRIRFKETERSSQCQDPCITHLQRIEFQPCLVPVV